MKSLQNKKKGTQILNFIKENKEKIHPPFWTNKFLFSKQKLKKKQQKLCKRIIMKKSGRRRKEEEKQKQKTKQKYYFTARK